MINFRLTLPTTLVFGPGEFSRLGVETAAIGRKALIVTGRSSARKLGYLQRAEEMLEKSGVDSIVYDHIEPNPRHDTCDAGAKLAREEGCDVIVALGGGSVMDAAKAIAASAVSGRSCWDYTNGAENQVAIEGAIPILVVPTTAATGSEADGLAVITNSETLEKCVLFGVDVFPKVAICDPKLHLAIPPDVTADGCVDIFSHYIESYVSGEADCGVQDRIAEGLMNVVFEWGPVAYQNGQNLRARRELQYASALALSGLPSQGRGGSFPMHAIEHSLSGHYDIAHGRGLAIVNPRVMRYTYKVIPHRYAQFGRRCFGITESDDLKASESAINAFIGWLDSIGENLTLGDVGIGDEKFDVMAEDVVRNYGNGKVMPYLVPLDKAAIIEILQMCREPNK